MFGWFTKSDPSSVKIRQNPYLWISGALLTVTGFYLFPTPHTDSTWALAGPVLLIAGLLLSNLGGNTWISDTHVILGLSKLPLEDIANIDSSDPGRIILHLKNSTRAYRFRRWNYHPEGWTLLQHRLGIVYSPTSSPA